MLQKIEKNIMSIRVGKKRPRSCISKSGDSSKPVRKVSFGNQEVRSEDVKHEGMSSENSNIWYTKSELASFARQARDHVLGCGHQWTDQCTRGFERYDFARAEQKAMTRKIIVLLMQQKELSDEEKSLVATRSSAWAVDEAFVMGCKDFCEAYHPHMSHLLEQKQDCQADINSLPNTQIMQNSMKRKLCNPEHRNVRARSA